MPDVRRFIDKHRETAAERGVDVAVRNALLEAGVWSYSRARDRLVGPGRFIWAEDWDICVVVDACRWDLWLDVVDGTDWPPDVASTPPYYSAWSVGSASPEWYGRTFAPEQLPVDESIGVVTANPFAGKPGDVTPLDEREELDLVDYVFADAWGCEVDGTYLDVTHPAVVTNRAYRAWRRHELDRLVVHYMQPHIPFRSRPEWFGVRENLRTFGEAVRDGEDPYRDGSVPVWRRVAEGVINVDAVWSAYADNLRWVLEDVDRLRTAVDGSLLVTSDHGNAMGERGLWSHPPGMHIEALRRVPWIRLRGRGAEWQERDVASSTAPSIDVDDQLAALGYV